MAPTWPMLINQPEVACRLSLVKHGRDCSRIVDDQAGIGHWLWLDWLVRNCYIDDHFRRDFPFSECPGLGRKASELPEFPTSKPV
jgi:hypothetical protein